MNITIFTYLYSFAHQSSILDWLIVFAANNFGYLAVAMAFLYLFFHADGKLDYRTPFLQLKNKIKEISLVFSSAVAAFIIESILKHLWPAPRPFILFDWVRPLFLHGGMDSFPSGHAMFFSALALSLYFVHKKIGYIYFLIALIVGLARIMAGVHFPIDIIVGYVLGGLIALIFKLIFQKSFKL